MSSRLHDTHLERRVHANTGSVAFKYARPMANSKPMSWGVIIVVMVVTAVVAGMTLGLLNEATGINPGAGVGAVVGVVGALLIGNRARAVAAQKNQP